MPPPGQDPGPFLSFLDWLNTAGEVPLNVLRGRPGAAGRKALDFLGDIPDAVLPGDWIPDASTEEDAVSASDVLGIDPMRNPAGAKVADIIGGTIANPLSYLGLRGAGPVIQAPLPLQGVIKGQVPLTGVSSLIDKGKSLARTGWEKLPESVTEPIAEGAAATGDLTRRTLNWLSTSPEDEALLTRASGAGDIASKVHLRNVEDYLGGLSQAEREAVGELGQRINRMGTDDRSKWQTILDDESYLASRPDIRADEVRRAYAAHRAQAGNQFDEGLAGGVFAPDIAYLTPSGQRISQKGLQSQFEQDLKAGLSAEDDLAGYAAKRGFVPDKTVAGTPGYMSRQFDGEYFRDIEDPYLNMRKGGGSGAPLRGREEALSTPEGLLRFLQREKDADLEFDAAKVNAKRAEMQGRLIQKGSIGKEMFERGRAERIKMLSDDLAKATPDEAPAIQKRIDEVKSESFALAKGEHRTEVDRQIAKLANSDKASDRDFAYQLENAWRGIPPRSKNWFAQGLHKANQVFKGAATYGVIFPRLAFHVGNRLSGTLGQVLSNPEARRFIRESGQRIPGDLGGAFKDGLIHLRKTLEEFDNEFVKSVGGVLPKGGGARGAMSQRLQDIDDAFSMAKGSTEDFRKILSGRPDGEKLLMALDNRVLDDFVTSEDLLRRMADEGTWGKIKDVANWPAKIGQGVEQRMRIGTFFDLIDSGVDPAAAAKTVKGTFLDYGKPGIANRRFRDIIPFGAFLSQNVKQQAKFIAEQPSIAVAASQLYGDDQGLPKYPWLEQQAAVPWGLDEQGNAQYITSFRQPIEGLTAIPGLGANDLYRDVVGSMQPLLKTGIAYAVDKDPFTGREFGEYDKIMGQEAGKLGRAYNVIMGTGLTQAVGTPMGQLANLADERKSIAERALQFGTGMRFTSVDPDLAERQQLEDYLETRPEIRTAPGYYQTGEDDELAQVLKDLRAAKARLKEKRAAANAL